MIMERQIVDDDLLFFFIGGDFLLTRWLGAIFL
jgi:hypothetical protein